MSDQLVRALSHRQIQVMAIGGAIGVGLFLGSGKAIHDAGPAVLLCYALGGAVVFLMLRALGEMAVARPVSGSFASYADEEIGPWAGYATGWTYWLMWTTTVMAEITAVGIYVQFFFDGVPQWLPALASVVTLLAANLVSVRVFGETEFWFALIKIVAFIASGVAIVAFGAGSLDEQAAVSNLWSHGGFFPEGIGGMLEALQIVTFAFLGIELIGVLAGEARNPERELPTAINRVVWRISLFYLGAILVILMLIPWNQVSLEESPFVIAWESIGIGAAAGILNGVVITSALSSSNSGIFASARMLFSLSGSGEAPHALHALSRAHVPARALLVSGVALAVGVLLNVLVPGKAFVYITSVATVGILWVWATIAVSHLHFRARQRRAGSPPGRFPMPGSPWTNYVVLAYIALVAVLLAATPDQRVAVIAGVVWAALLALGWWRISRRYPDLGGAVEAAPKPPPTPPAPGHPSSERDEEPVRISRRSR
jgi:AAT family amino acid transporter